MRKKENEKEDEKQKENEKDYSDGEEIGTITGIYNINENFLNTRLPILGNKFVKTFDLNIFVDGSKVKYSPKYSFTTAGEHKVEIKIYQKFSMDYMFNGVTNLNLLQCLQIKIVK